jgi:5'-nucleotidase
MSQIALFDMDGTIVDYDGQLKRDLIKIASPNEAPINEVYNAMPPYIEARRHMITSQVGWWLKLEKLPIGWAILEQCKSIGFNISVLTKAPSTKYHAWAEKIQWCNEYLKDYIDGVTMTHNKGLVYGKVLVDDYPEYILKWLEFRPRGLVIMPVNGKNKDFSHPNVVKCDGTNMNEVTISLYNAYNRNISEEC